MVGVTKQICKQDSGPYHTTGVVIIMRFTNRFLLSSSLSASISISLILSLCEYPAVVNTGNHYLYYISDDVASIYYCLISTPKVD